MPLFSLTNYREHYRADAEFIQNPEQLSSLRFASEWRRLEVAVRQLKLHPGVRVLDIGCGSGWLGHECAAAGAWVTAMDIAPAGVTVARERFPDGVEYAVADLYNMPVKPARYDVAILSEVLEHVERIDDALEEVRRVLVPGGRVMITVPFRETILEHLCIHCNCPTPSNAHLHRFDTGTLAECLVGNGFSVDSVIHLNNKLLELIGFPNRTRRWPYWAWRGFDRLFNRLIGRAAFALTVGTRSSA